MTDDAGAGPDAAPVVRVKQSAQMRIGATRIDLDRLPQRLQHATALETALVGHRPADERLVVDQFVGDVPGPDLRIALHDIGDVEPVEALGLFEIRPYRPFDRLHGPVERVAVVLLVVTPPTVFGVLTSAQALVVTLFGGVGTVWGPLAGATILIPLAETLHAELGHYLHGIHGVVYGLAIVLIILLIRALVTG
jgi:hypothetical protein